jgi:CheY-like chemotaxis protein
LRVLTLSFLELKTVLVVDGSPVARSLLAHLLKPYCCKVVELSSVEEAKVALSGHESVSLVIVDARVEGGGLALLEHITGFAAERPLVIFLTSRPSLDEETQASLLGAIGYLVKPVSLREILRTLRGFEGPFTRALPRVRTAPIARAVVIDPETKTEQIAWDIWDMSASGALVSSHVPIPAGTRLQLRLQLEDDVVPVEAEVVRAQEPSWGLVPGIGVAFHFEDERRRKTLERFVEGKDE